MHFLSGKNIGFALTGSHCTLSSVLPVLERMALCGANVIPIFSENVFSTDTRFFSCHDLIDQVSMITGRLPIHTIAAAEPIGPKKLLDLLIVAPCTGNTLAKLALGITDTCVTMAVKAQLRNERPVVLAISTNDALGANARNLGSLMTMRNIYFVPFSQDSPEGKPTSLIADMASIEKTCEYAFTGRQIQPIML